MPVAIIDLEVGNCGSIANALKKLGVSSVITQDLNVIRDAERIILPGVGAFDTVSRAVDSLNLRQGLVEIANKAEQPLLGICVGMQILAEHSEEGSLPGLGIISGSCKRFQDTTLRIPHMGWNKLSFMKDCPLFTHLDAASRFYFVHSYYVEPTEEVHIAAQTSYGLPFSSVVQSGKVFGVQFHPEKSHRYGLALFKAFVEL